MSFEDLGPIEFQDLGPLHYKLPRENQVDPELRDKFAAMALDFYNQTGEPLKVTDSFRSNAEQADLYKRKPTLAAPPGKSRHEFGAALDIDMGQVPKLEELGLLDTHGFVRPALSKGETWHIELPRAEKLAGKIAATTSEFKDLGPIQGEDFQDLGTAEKQLETISTFAPTKEQAEAAAKTSGVAVEPGLEQPTFLDPTNVVAGLPGIGRAAAGSLLSGLTTRQGLSAMAKALPGFLGTEALGGAAYSALEGEKRVPEWAKLPLAMAAGVGGGLATSKALGALARKSPVAPAPFTEYPAEEIGKLAAKKTDVETWMGQIKEGNWSAYNRLQELSDEAQKSATFLKTATGMEQPTKILTPEAAKETEMLNAWLAARRGRLDQLASQRNELTEQIYNLKGRPVIEPTPVATPGVKPNVQAGAVESGHLESPDMGKPIITRQIVTEHDSTLGPKGTVAETIPLQEGHVALREAFDGTKDIPKPKFQNIKDTFKTNERIFSEINDLAPGFQNEFWGKMKQAENVAHNNTQALFKEVDDLTSQVGKKTMDKIGIDFISKRRTGAERLQKMGITPEPLTPEETQIAEQFQVKFKEYLVKLNEARALAGKQPIKEDPNYFTFMGNFVDRVSQGVNPITGSANMFTTPTATPFRFEKAMGGKEAVETNLAAVFKNYAALAERHINISPHLEKINKFTSEMVLPNGTVIPPLSKSAPNAAAALDAMATVISGVKPPMSRTGRILSKASDNLVISTLGAYPKSVINQTGSLAAGGAETGPVNLIKGLLDVLKPGSLKYAAENSHVLAQRKMDIVLEELGATWANKLSSKAKHYAMLPLEVVDNLMAHGVWNGAVRKGLQMGMDETAAHRFADKIVVRTQASASPIDRAMVQQSVPGRLLTAFQTFSIADANWIARNIFGKGNINFKTAEGVKKLILMSGIGMGLNLVQREVLGLQPGLPEPTHAFTKAQEEGAGPGETAWDVAKEFAPFVPVFGSMAYGKAPFGALGGLGADFAKGDKTAAESLAMLAGVPGMNMIIKGLKTQGGRELLTDVENATGLPVGPRTKLTKPPSTIGEVLFGREPAPRKRKPGRIDELLMR